MDILEFCILYTLMLQFIPNPSYFSTSPWTSRCVPWRSRASATPCQTSSSAGRTGLSLCRQVPHCSVVPYPNKLNYTIPYHTILYPYKPHHTIPNHTIQYKSMRQVHTTCEVLSCKDQPRKQFSGPVGKLKSRP